MYSTPEQASIIRIGSLYVAALEISMSIVVSLGESSYRAAWVRSSSVTYFKRSASEFLPEDYSFLEETSIMSGESSFLLPSFS